MKIQTVGLITCFIGVTGTSFAVDQYPVSIAHPDELVIQEIASKIFPSLPIQHQAIIAEFNGIGSQGFGSHPIAQNQRKNFSHIPQGTTATEFLALHMSDELKAEMTEQQLKVLNKIASNIDNGIEVPSMCFAPGTNSKFAYMIDQMFDYQFATGDSRFQQRDRWSRTATDGSGLTQGDPTTITYSFAPDGAMIPDAGFGSGPSTLFQWLNGLYGSPASWQQLFHGVFDRWEELTGLSFIYEPNDDGAMMTSALGQTGVRGDIRIFGFNYPFDGDWGVLAYNYYPDNGDMAFDAFDSFYDSTSGNSLRFRNVTSHELGHGIGMAHTCPATGTIIMEPFINTNFDGPQLDDILNGIRHYGDIVEPNNSVGQATDFGTLQPGSALDFMNVGIDDNSDLDFYRITVSQSSQITFTATPDADAYIQGPQTPSCDTGSMTDYNSIQDLVITVRDASNTILETSNFTGLGSAESIIFDALSPGDYYFVVGTANNANSVQRYRLDVGVEGLGFVNPTFITEIPDVVTPTIESTFAVTINPQSDTILEGTEKIYYSINGGPFVANDLVSTGASTYTATIPATACHDSLMVYLSVEGAIAGEVTFPANGASDPFTPVVSDLVAVFADDFETDQGWTVTGPVNGTFSGEWERGVPMGLGNRGDPLFDADLSGSAYLTGNEEGNTDVDGGRTILRSPTFALANYPDAVVSYARWYDNTGGGTGTAPGEDVFLVEVSNNGGANWTLLESVGPDTDQSIGGWMYASFTISDFINVTNGIRFRFIAEDIGAGSVVEAGVDAFTIEQLCPPPPVNCIADFNDDGAVNFFDVSAFLTAFNEQAPEADINEDGVHTFFDVSMYLQEFAAGCP